MGDVSATSVNELNELISEGSELRLRGVTRVRGATLLLEFDVVGTPRRFLMTVPRHISSDTARVISTLVADDE